MSVSLNDKNYAKYSKLGRSEIEAAKRKKAVLVNVAKLDSICSNEMKTMDWLKKPIPWAERNRFFTLR